MTEKYIIAINVTVQGKVTKMGAVWDGKAVKTVRARAEIFTTAEEAESKRFWLSCQLPLMMGRIEVVKLLEDDPERRYHLIGGEKIVTE